MIWLSRLFELLNPLQNPLISTNRSNILYNIQAFWTKQETRRPHLFDSVKQLPIRVDNDEEWEDEAEDKEADDVGDIVGRLGRPVHWAGGSGPLGSIATPTEERRQSPDDGVDPGQHNSRCNFPVVGGVRLGRTHHRTVALIGKYSQGDEWHNACRDTLSSYNVLS